MMDLWHASVQCFFQGFQGQRLRQMLTQMPSSNHASEDIHEHRNIDEASVETNIRYIANPDLILATDVKHFESIHPRLRTFKRSCGLTGNPFHRYREILFFHQSSNAAIPNGVSLIRQQLRDTSIPVCRIPPT
jgi:hypothetical protein